MSAVAETPLRFELPPQLEAGAPPEALGRSRDDVRLLASHRRSGDHLHTRFRELPLLLSPGDLVVINTSATLPAAVPARRPDGEEIELRYSGGDLVELRRFEGDTTVPLLDAHAGELLELPAYAGARLLRRHDGSRLWRARLALGGATLVDYLHRHGHPIRYAYAERAWPLSAYQTVYADEPGSAEMPSAGRAFTRELLRELDARGIAVAPLVLHTGVSSLETGERPAPEQFRVPAATAAAVNSARAAGRRVVAVGTTVIRALATVTQPDGRVRGGAGTTELVIEPDDELPAIDGLLTGWHEPRSTHLAMLTAVAGIELLADAYAKALAHRYLWHEFGDLHLILR